MQINLAQLLKKPVGTTRDYEIEETVDVSGEGTGNKVWGNIRLTHTNRGILVEGVLHTDIKSMCSRCLCSFNQPLTLKIEEEYFPTTDVITGESMSLPDEPGYFTLDEHHVIDLTEAVQQYALMAMPMKPLCREDCAGICPGCGHNLNLEGCSCPSG